MSITSASTNRHGLRGTPTHVSWAAMRQRCNGKSRENYAYYGGRGIKVCKRWDSFKVFLADMGERPEGHSLDRIDTDGDYEPTNCRWAPTAEQAANRRFNHRIELDGEVVTLAELARRINVPRARLMKRLKLGWSYAEAIAGRRNV